VISDKLLSGWRVHRLSLRAHLSLFTKSDFVPGPTDYSGLGTVMSARKRGNFKKNFGTASSPPRVSTQKTCYACKMNGHFAEQCGPDAPVQVVVPKKHAERVSMLIAQIEKDEEMKKVAEMAKIAAKIVKDELYGNNSDGTDMLDGNVTPPEYRKLTRSSSVGSFLVKSSKKKSVPEKKAKKDVVVKPKKPAIVVVEEDDVINEEEDDSSDDDNDKHEVVVVDKTALDEAVRDVVRSLTEKKYKKSKGSNIYHLQNRLESVVDPGMLDHVYKFFVVELKVVQGNDKTMRNAVARALLEKYGR